VTASARIRPALSGAALGAFAGFLLAELGLADVLGLLGAPALVVCGFATGAVIGARGLGLLLEIADITLLAVYGVVAFTPLASALGGRWVRTDRLPPQRLDAAIVLSGGVMSDSLLGVRLAERLLTGLELVRDGKAARLVTTRVSTSYGARAITSDADQRRLVHLAGADSVWTIVDSATSTRTEADHAASMLLPAGIHSIAVVTSTLHTRRACAAFEHVGFRVYCVPAFERDRTRWRPVTPADRLATVRVHLYERLAWWKYRRAGWLAAPSQ
jgi:uncharacterized SAM-binding protein YcdF (DUF218 family)